MTTDKLLDDCERAYNDYLAVPRWRVLHRMTMRNRWLGRVFLLEERETRDARKRLGIT